jgi:alanine racemase
VGEALTPRHPAWVEIDLTALVHNADVLRQAIPSDARLGLMVKANAYGHGLEMAARAAVAGGADQLIVAAIDEGLALRAAGIEAPILVIYPVAPAAVCEAVEAGLELTVSGLASTGRTLAAWMAGGPGAVRRELRVHVEVDTGMGRGGVSPDALVGVVERIEGTPGATVAGIWSHLADGGDMGRSLEQTQRYEAALARVGTTGRAFPIGHLAATDAVFAGTAPAYQMVRIGLGFYGELGLGIEPVPSQAALASALRPALTIKARPVRIDLVAAGASVGYGGEWTAHRPSRIATLPIGYADGWTRSSWPGASALLRGRRVPLVGRVSMDSVCADVTELDAQGEVTIDEVLVLLGAQGDDRITANELARLRGTIPNEVLAGLGARLPRVYVDDDGLVAVSQQADRVDRVSGTRW